jgi:hypothetical protein
MPLLLLLLLLLPGPHIIPEQAAKAWPTGATLKAAMSAIAPIAPRSCGAALLDFIVGSPRHLLTRKNLWRRWLRLGQRAQQIVGEDVSRRRHNASRGRERCRTTVDYFRIARPPQAPPLPLNSRNIGKSRWQLYNDSYQQA